MFRRKQAVFDGKIVDFADENGENLWLLPGFAAFGETIVKSQIYKQETIRYNKGCFLKPFFAKE